MLLFALAACGFPRALDGIDYRPAPLSKVDLPINLNNRSLRSEAKSLRDLG